MPGAGRRPRGQKNARAPRHHCQPSDLRPGRHPVSSLLTGLRAPRPTPASALRAAAWRAGIARRCSLRIPGASRAARACRGRAGERAPRVATQSPPRAPTGRAERVPEPAGSGPRKAPPSSRCRPPPRQGLITLVESATALPYPPEHLQCCPCDRAGSSRGES